MFCGLRCTDRLGPGLGFHHSVHRTFVLGLLPGGRNFPLCVACWLLPVTRVPASASTFISVVSKSRRSLSAPHMTAYPMPIGVAQHAHSARTSVPALCPTPGLPSPGHKAPSCNQANLRFLAELHKTNMTSITENILAFVETPAGEPRPSAPPYGYVWADEYFTKVDVGTDGQPATRWPVALQV